MAVPTVALDDRAPSLRADEECSWLYRRYGGEILRYCNAKLRSRADAEDVAQQVFVRVYGALLRGERVRLPRHWLLRIARNECRRFATRRRRVQEVEFDEAIDAGPGEEQPRWSPAEIRRALDELVPAQRHALVMRELEGRPYAEIARELGLTLSAVETLIFRARRSLREQLDGAIACGAAEHALSLELDGHLPQDARPGLRAHLRGCAECRRLARRHRARRHALRSLVPLPLQGPLASLVGGGGGIAAGGAVAGTGAALKVAAVLSAGALTAGIGLAPAREPRDAKEVPRDLVASLDRLRPAPRADASRAPSAGRTPSRDAASATLAQAPSSNPSAKPDRPESSGDAGASTPGRATTDAAAAETPAPAPETAVTSTVASVSISPVLPAAPATPIELAPAPEPTVEAPTLPPSTVELPPPPTVELPPPPSLP